MQRFSFAEHGTRWQDLLDDDRIDVVSVAVPNQLHFPLARGPLMDGKHVLCEKPLANDARDAHELHRVASAGAARTVIERDTIAHVQVCPDDADLIFYAGPFKDRIWTVRVDGSEHRSHVQRSPGQWITHETWLPGRLELAFVDWPHAVRAVDVRTGAVRDLLRLNAWHASASRDGSRMVADTNHPDRGIVTFATDGSGGHEVLCAADSSNEGEHWRGPFPYEDGPIQVQARQHTHPHPTFSPDGSRVVFNSDRSGWAQVYEVAVP